MRRKDITQTSHLSNQLFELTDALNKELGIVTETRKKLQTELKKPLNSERTFAIFLDFKNLDDGLTENRIDKTSNFSWLIDPILKQGKIIFAFVFIPEHYLGYSPIMQLSYKHRFQVIICPRQIGGFVTKDADTVDAKIGELARPLIEHCDFTDLVIISGDADFQPLVSYAKWHQKNVLVVSATEAISGRFMEMATDGTIKLQLVP